MKTIEKRAKWTQLLIALEVTVRHQAVGLAAAEIGSTSREVSRSLRELEEVIGTDLFVRGPGGVGLTQAGELLHLAAAAGGQDIRAAGCSSHRTTQEFAYGFQDSGYWPEARGKTR